MTQDTSKALDMVETLRLVEERAAKVVKIDELVALLSHDLLNPISAALNQLHLAQANRAKRRFKLTEIAVGSLIEELAAETEFLCALKQISVLSAGFKPASPGFIRSP